MKIRITILLILLLTVYYTASADGVITGVVVDGDTWQTVPDAEINIYACHCSPPIFRGEPVATVYTNEFGGYDLCLPDGTYLVEPTLAEGEIATPKNKIVYITPCESYDE